MHGTITKRFELSENYLLDVEVKPSGVPDLYTLELYATYPQAQHPRKQRITQLTMTPCQLWEFSAFVQNGFRCDSKR